MKGEKIYDGITNIREQIVEEAGSHKFRKRRNGWFAAVAAVLVLCLAFGLLRPGGPAVLSAYAISEAVYPKAVPYPDDDTWVKYERWSKDREKRVSHPPYSDGLSTFLTQSTQTFLSGSGETNPVYSPLSVYMALAMTAELTDGTSRQQILDALGETDLEALREQANTLWNANYSNDGALTTILAGSLWLSDEIDYRLDTMQALSRHYYASAFQGPMGDEAYSGRLRQWINDQTGNLLTEQAAGQELDSETVMSLVTTVFFQGKWMDTNRFLAENNTMDTFHAPDGDVSAEFMHDTTADNYYWADQFGAVSLSMEGGTEMWLLLPDEGVTPEALISDPQTMEFILAGQEWENQEIVTIDLAVPKFDVSCDLDLSEGLQALGITDVFDGQTADFGPMTQDVGEVWLSDVPHAARVAIDEEGCTAASFTMLRYYGAMDPPDYVNFVLDRPFLFAITGSDGLPVFVGIVNEP